MSWSRFLDLRKTRSINIWSVHPNCQASAELRWTTTRRPERRHYQLRPSATLSTLTTPQPCPDAQQGTYIDPIPLAPSIAPPINIQLLRAEEKYPGQHSGHSTNTNPDFPKKSSSTPPRFQNLFQRSQSLVPPLRRCLARRFSSVRDARITMTTL